MLTSLFGDLAPPRQDGAADFVDTLVLDAPPAPGTPRGLPRDGRPNEVDVFVAGSPAQAMRQHFATRLSAAQPAASMVTLLDPSQLWAPAVVKALSDACGQPVQRLHLRERSTLRTLAVVERATLPHSPGLQGAGTPSAMKVYHADIRARGAQHDEIATALAERSQLTTVIVGTLDMHALGLLLDALMRATAAPQWHCPWLVFLVPPGADEATALIEGQRWPAGLRAAVVPVALASASDTWNTVLAAWNLAQAEPVAAPGAEPAARALSALARTEGVLACGVASLHDGQLQALQTRTDQGDALAHVARALVLARLAHATACGDDRMPGELLATLGQQVQLLRALPESHRGVVLLLERGTVNLSLVRQKLAELEKLL